MSKAVEYLTQTFGSDISLSEFRDNRRIVASAKRAFEVLQSLKEKQGFDLLVDVTAVDYLEFPGAKDRFGVVYVLLNTATGERLIVKTFVNDPDPMVKSVYHLWRGADWMEREVYDMFGITFEGHPDLRRILMPEGFVSYPLRKDYPLRGRGERHNFEPLIRSES